MDDGLGIRADANRVVGPTEWILGPVAGWIFACMFDLGVFVLAGLGGGK